MTFMMTSLGIQARGQGWIEGLEREGKDEG